MIKDLPILRNDNNNHDGSGVMMILALLFLLYSCHGSPYSR